MENMGYKNNTIITKVSSLRSYLEYTLQAFAKSTGDKIKNTIEKRVHLTFSLAYQNTDIYRNAL